jgi:Xylose isomerase-like TIM barrel
MSWEIGISTGIAYQVPIEEVLPSIAANGFRTIEVATARSHVDPKDSARVQALREQVLRLGLAVRSLHAPFGQGIDITDADDGLRRLSVRHLREAADLLKALGGELYVIHPGGEDHNWIWEKEARLGRSVEGFTEVWGICRERGLARARGRDSASAPLGGIDPGFCLDPGSNSRRRRGDLRRHLAYEPGRNALRGDRSLCRPAPASPGERQPRKAR